MQIDNQILTILVGLFFVWLLVVSFVLLKIYSVYKSLTEGIDKDDFALVLKKIKKQLKSVDSDLDDIEKAIGDLKEEIKPHIQKMGFVRYNPFGNTGGDQSFCLSLLDDRDSGIIITSLHTRNQTRIYAKPIKNGKALEGVALSKEESKCIKEAKTWSKS